MVNNYIKVLGRQRNTVGAAAEVMRSELVLFDDTDACGAVVAKEKADRLAEEFRSAGLIAVLSTFRPCRMLAGIVGLVGDVERGIEGR